MKIILLAGNMPSSCEWLKRTKKSLIENYENLEIRTGGFFGSNFWNLNACFSPYFGVINKEQLTSDIKEFSPDYIIIHDFDILNFKQLKLTTISCAGFSCFAKKARLQVLNEKLSKFNKDKYSFCCPVNFWPEYIDEGFGNYQFLSPEIENRELKKTKGYLYFDYVKEIDFLPVCKKETFITYGSTYDIVDALNIGIENIKFVPNTSDTESMMNNFLIEKYCWGKSYLDDCGITNIIPKKTKNNPRLYEFFRN